MDHNGYTDEPGRQKKEGGCWIRKRSIYQIMLKDYAPRFGTASTFGYITRDLERLYRLGVGTLWLTGLAKNEDGVTPFSVLDPLVIEECYGQERELRDLLRAAHAYGLKMIIDFIPNHVSRLSELCALHPGWFIRDPGGRIISATDRRGQWEWPGLAQFDFLNPAVIGYLLDVGRHWLEFGFDGFRLDAPLALVKQRMTENWYADRLEAVERAYPEEFWRIFIREMRKVNPGAGFLAESFGGYRELLEDCGVDLTLDAGFSYILHEVLRENAPAKKLSDYLALSLSGQFSLVHYKDGHDIRDVNFNGRGMELLRNLDAAEIRLAGLLLATLPGVPMYYNGEIEAVLGYPYFHDRAHPIPWHCYDPEMKFFYTRLLQLAARPVFRQGKSLIPGLKPGGSPDILFFGREYEDEKIIVAANLKRNPEKGCAKDWVHLDLDRWIKDRIRQYHINDIFSKKLYPAIPGADIARNGLPVGLEPGEIQVLRLVPRP